VKPVPTKQRRLSCDPGHGLDGIAHDFANVPDVNHDASLYHRTTVSEPGAIATGSSLKFSSCIGFLTQQPRTIASKVRCVEFPITLSLRLNSTLSFYLLFFRRMKELLLELPYARVIVSIADDSVNATGDVAAAYIANDSSIGCGEPARMLLKPIVILDGGFDPAIGRDVHAHLRQEFPRALQL